METAGKKVARTIRTRRSIKSLNILESESHQLRSEASWVTAFSQQTCRESAMWEAGKCNRNTLRKQPHSICEFYGRLLFGTAWHTIFPPDGMEQPAYTVSTVRRGHSPIIGGIFALFQQMSYWIWDHEYFASRKLLTLGSLGNFQLPGAAVNTLAATAPFRKVVWGGA